MDDLAALFSEHVKRLQAETEKALAATGHDSLVVWSGAPHTYFADDQDAPFRPVPHFAHWCPLGGPHHLLHVVPGRKPRLVRHAPEDYWYEQGGATEPSGWTPSLRRAGPPTPSGKHSASQRRPGTWATKRPGPKATGSPVNPKPLTARLTGCAATRTTTRCIRSRRRPWRAPAATERRARPSRRGPPSSRSTRCLPRRRGDRGAAALRNDRRLRREGRDAALRVEAAHEGRPRAAARRRGTEPRLRLRHHAHDTRARLRPALRRAHRVGRRDRAGPARAATPGRPYLEVHLQAHAALARVLSDMRLLRVSAEEAFVKGYTHPFFPHGVGHHLGIQVHDVAGRQSDASGTPAPPPKEHPYLRNTRTIEPGHVFTIEPGIYFIPMLPAPLPLGSGRRAHSTGT